MEETTTPKPVNEMTLTEINQEIESLGGVRKKRIDHARSLLQAIRNGKVTGPQAAEMAAKKAIEKARKQHAKVTNINPNPTEEEITTMATTTKSKPAKRAKRPHKAATHRAKKNGNGPTKSIIKAEFRSQYIRDPKVKTESGAATIHNGDALARAMAGLTQADFKKIARDNGVLDRFEGWTESLNPGQVRLNLGNVLRGMARRGEEVTIQGKRVKVPKLAKNGQDEE